MINFNGVTVTCAADGAGISDPCEKEATDAIGHLDHQQREDITASAQVSETKYACMRSQCSEGEIDPVSCIFSMP